MHALQLRLAGLSAALLLLGISHAIENIDSTGTLHWTPTGLSISCGRLQYFDFLIGSGTISPKQQDVIDFSSDWSAV
jgi:hypothetical protein